MAKMIGAMNEITATSQEISKIIKIGYLFSRPISGARTAVEPRAPVLEQRVSAIVPRGAIPQSWKLPAIRPLWSPRSRLWKTAPKSPALRRIPLRRAQNRPRSLLSRSGRIADAAEHESESIDQIMQGIDQISTGCTDQFRNERRIRSGKRGAFLGPISCVRFSPRSMSTVPPLQNSGGSPYAGGLSPDQGDTFRRPPQQENPLPRTSDKY